jgi:hypothetical protein
MIGPQDLCKIGSLFGILLKFNGLRVNLGVHEEPFQFIMPGLESLQPLD